MTLRRAPTSGRGVAHGLAVAIGIPSELAVPAGERAVAAMMALKQARDAGGGALRGQHLLRAQQHIAALDPARHSQLAQHLQAHALALQGRGGDTRIAHVTPGEVVVPKRLQNPEFLRGLEVLARAHGIDPTTLRVDSGRNAINPRTGQMEFDDGNIDDDFGDFDPGNFDVNDLSNYVTPTDELPHSGSYYPGQGLPSSVGYNPVGLLASPPISQGTGQSQYVDGDGNPIEGITVTAPKPAGRSSSPPSQSPNSDDLGPDDFVIVPSGAPKGTPPQVYHLGPGIPDSGPLPPSARLKLLLPPGILPGPIPGPLDLRGKTPQYGPKYGTNYGTDWSIPSRVMPGYQWDL